LGSFEDDFVPTLEYLGFDYVLQTGKRGKPKQGVGLVICFRSSVLRLRYQHSRSRAMFAVFSPVRASPVPTTAAPPASPPCLPSIHSPTATISPAAPATLAPVSGSPPPPRALAAPPTVQAGPAAAAQAAAQVEDEEEEEAISEEDLFVCNVHLDGAPELVDVRFQQTKSILQRLLAYQQQHQVRPERSRCVFGGDFNCGALSSVYRLLAEGRVEAGTTECGRLVTKTEFAHPFAFVSAQVAVFGREPEFTFVLGKWRSTIDFLFYHHPSAECVRASPALHTSSYALKRRSLLERALPSAEHPSDHLPLRCTLRFPST
jgi:mRNA deadenylase 3'-5' endonuclease subunit Ccr4